MQKGQHMERLGSEQKSVMLTVNWNTNVNQGQGEAEGKPEAVRIIQKGRYGLESQVVHLDLILTVLGSQERVIDSRRT